MSISEIDLRGRSATASRPAWSSEKSFHKWLSSWGGGPLVLASVSLVFGWRPLLKTIDLALHDYEYTHLLLILPISATLILLEWRSLRPMVASNIGAGFVLLGTAMLTRALMALSSASFPSDVGLSIEMFALVLSWIGIFVLCLGSGVARTVLFPLCLLFALVPLPQFVLNFIVGWLQQGSALAAHELFAAVGVPVTQNGVMLMIPGLTLEVAKECSSIRSSSMLLVTTLVLAQLLLRSPWRRGLLVAVAVPLSVIKNGLRIFTIGMLAIRVDPAYLTGNLHRQGGIVFLVIALIGVFAVLWALRRREQVPDQMPGQSCGKIYNS